MIEPSYKSIGIGVVSSDKAPNSTLLSIMPVEQFPLFEGEINDKHTLINREFIDDDGKKITVNLQVSSSMQAEWMSEPNRITAPSIVKGEQVELFTMGTTGRFYWKTLARDDSLRRQETFSKAFIASGKGTDVGINRDASNHYNMMVDTKGQMVALTTSKDNKEFTTHNVSIDTKNGIFTYQDGIGNTFQIEGQKAKIILANSQRTTIVVEGDTATVIATNINLVATNINVKGNLNIDGNLTGTSNANFQGSVSAPTGHFGNIPH